MKPLSIEVPLHTWLEMIFEEIQETSHILVVIALTIRKNPSNEVTKTKPYQPSNKYYTKKYIYALLNFVL